VIWTPILVDAVHLAILALAIGFLVHETGLLPLGYTAMVLVGAYAFGAAAMSAISVWTTPIIVVLASVVLALPALRVREYVFAVVGLASAEAIRLLAIAVPEVTGGPLGLGPFPRSPVWVDSALVVPLASLVAAAALYVLGACGRVGLTLGLIRDDQLLAEASGVCPGVDRMLAAAIGGAVAAGVGALQAGWYAFVSPELGAFDVSLQAVAVALLGGGFWRQGQPGKAIAGILFGSLLIAAIPPTLRSVLPGNADLAVLRKALFGVFLYAAIHPRSPLARAIAWRL
jgi:branched-chain amino acid transport system permease protein